MPRAKEGTRFIVTVESDGEVYPPVLHNAVRVAAGLQKACEAAVEGQERDFVKRMHEIRDAMEDWYDELWGKEKKGEE